MYKRHVGERRSLSPYFYILFAVGVMLTVLFSEQLGLDALLTEGNLYYLRKGDMYYHDFFAYVLGKRFFLLAFMLCLFMGNQYRFYVKVTLMLLGIGVGSFFAMCVNVYGIVGIFFFLMMGFPQFFFYVPVIYFCCHYVAGPITDVKRYILQIFFLGILVLTGCITESYVNPFFLSKFLRFF